MAKLELTDSGLTIPTFAETRQANLDAWRAEFGDVDDSPNSPDGRIIDIDSEREQSNVLSVQDLASAISPDNAEGALLDNFLGMVGTERKQATATEVEVTCIGTPGASVSGIKRIRIQQNAPNAGTIFRYTSGWTFDATGSATVTFECEQTGPLTVQSETLTEIVAGDTNWTSASNPEDGTRGTDYETDSEAKVRRELSLGSPGASTNPALYAALLAIPNVTDVNILANNTDAILNGVPAWNVESIVEGGSDQDIADEIFAIRGTWGGVSGNTTVQVQDNDGVNVAIQFTRPTEIETWIHVQLSVNDSFNLGTQKKERVTIDSAVIGYAYTVTINGTTFSYTAIGGDTESDIAANLETAINGGVYVPVTASNLLGDTYVTLTANYAGNDYTATVAAANMTKTTITRNSGDQQHIINDIVDYSAGTLNIREVDGIQISGKQSVGDDVLLDKYNSPVNLNSNLTNVEIYASIVAALPTSQANIPINIRQKAVMSTYRTTVELV